MLQGSDAGLSRFDVVACVPDLSLNFRHGEYTFYYIQLLPNVLIFHRAQVQPHGFEERHGKRCDVSEH